MVYLIISYLHQIFNCKSLLQPISINVIDTLFCKLTHLLN